MSADRVVIAGVAESDAHAVANQLIAAHLREHGFVVVNLGVCTPLSEFASALVEHPAAEAVLIGSLNGHVHADLRGLPAFRERGLLNRPVIVGGNLSVGAGDRDEDVRRLHAIGVDHVLDDANEIPLLLDMLRAAQPQFG